VPTASLTYGSYLKVPELLALQQPLWFKLMLHELDAAVGFLDAGDLLKVAKAFRRIHAICRILVQQVDVLETMTPQDFNAFRSGLNPASGFQSAQFREIEFRCGLRGDEAAMRHLALTADERARLDRRLREPTLYDALRRYLARQGFDVSDHAALVATFKTIYEHDEEHYVIYLVLEDLMDFDESIMLWRSRHILMVERMIGMKPGTGGSLGVGYLESTLRKRFFPELWEVRTVLGAS
jgi:tryptophan 2,3-dioxygenase